MWLPSMLAGYAIAGTLFGGRLLAWRTWDRRAPRLALLAWQATMLSVTAAATLALLTASHHGWETLVTSLLHAQYPAVHSAYDLPDITSATELAAATGTLLVTRLLWGLATTAHTVRQQRQRHRRLLQMLARSEKPRRPGVRLNVVDAAQPAVYCLPGPRACTVVTTAAVRRLTPQQLDAVLAHERAQLRFRHHWLLTWGTALRAAFRPLPLFAAFGPAAARLVEMAADDQAGRQHGRALTASALLSLSGATPAGSVAAGSPTVERIERLVGPVPVRRRCLVACISAGTGALLALPAVVALLPALDVVGTAH